MDSTQARPAAPRRRGRRRLLIVLLGAACALLAFLALITVYSSDDFWYSTFMDRGALDYLRLMREHYLTFNGRMLVHFFAQLILHCGNWLFAVFLLLCCCLIPAAVYRSGGGERDLDGLLLCMLLFLCGVLLLPRSIAVNGLLWISASCNYVLPTAMAAGEILLLGALTRREGGRPGPAGAAALLYCFLCGATTEQMGAAAAGVAALYAIRCLAARRRRGLALGSLACACAGVLTIFLSPATRRRVETETVGDIAAGNGFALHMKGQLRLQADFFSGSPLLLIAFGVLFAFTAWLLLRGRKGWLGWLWAALSALALALLWAGEGRLLLLAYLAVVGLSALQTAVWLREGFAGPAFLLLAGLGSAGIILFTTSGGGRTYLPFCLCLLAVAAWALARAMGKLPAAACWGGALGVSLLAFAVMGAQLPGYWGNWQVDQANLRAVEEARQTGVLVYSMDYDRSYTHVKPYHDGYFYARWLESAGIDPAQCRIYFQQAGVPNVYVAGERTESPARPAAGGGWLLPLRHVVEGLGGSLELVDGTANEIRLTLDGREVRLSGEGRRITARWRDAGGAPRTLEGERTWGDYYAACCSEEIFTQALGLEVTERDGEIRVERPGGREKG